MPVLLWIVVAGVAMTAIAMVGSVTLLLSEQTLSRIILPLVAFAAGTLLGTAFFHMLPAATERTGTLDPETAAWLVGGFTVFLALEQLLHHHHHPGRCAECEHPVTYLVIVGDGLHNFVGGIAVGSAFVVDVRLGVVTWIAAALHEVPQELSDIGILIHGGWSRSKALVFNALSALTFLAGGLFAYAIASGTSPAFLLAFAAGNFTYIAASNLVPEIAQRRSVREQGLHLALFLGGAALMYGAALFE